MVEWPWGREEREGERGREIGWEESECHPSAAFQITLNSGKLDASRTLSPGLCCLWLHSTGCLSSLIGLTFPLSVLAVPPFSYVRWSGTSYISASKASANTGSLQSANKTARGEKKKSAWNSRGTGLLDRLSNRPCRFVDVKIANLS